MNRNQAFCIALVIFLLQSISIQQQQIVTFFILYMRWINSYQAMLNIAMIRRRNRRLRRQRTAPYAWSIPRPAESWFEIHYNDPTVPQEYFRQQLRVNKNTFDLIRNTLNARIVRENFKFRDCLPPEKVLALGLYRLAHGNSYSTIAPVFNVGKATVIEAVQDFVNGLYEIRDDHIKFPETLAEVTASIETFTDLTELPNVVGAIDGSHVRIKAPVDSAPDYFSRYQQHDFIIQAVVNGKKHFLDFACGFPGSMHDGRVLRRSRIFTRAEGGEILTIPTENVSGRQIGPYLVGDSAYPLSPWLMKPFPEGTRDRDEIKFNKQLSSARVKVECAFGVLKNRWRILMKRLDSSVEFAIRCAVACAVLHNICLRNGDDWDEGDDDGEDPGPPNVAADVLRDGDDIRDLLKDAL